MHACTCHHQTFQISILFYHIDQNLFRIRIWNGRKKILTKDSRRKKKCSFRKKKTFAEHFWNTRYSFMHRSMYYMMYIWAAKSQFYTSTTIHSIWKKSNEFAVHTHWFFLHNHYHSTELTATTATIWEKHMQRRHTLPTSMHRKKNLNPIAK